VRLDAVEIGGSSTSVTGRVHLPVIDGAAVVGSRLSSPAGQVIPASADPLLDQFARRIRYLRVSVTDHCNYRCTYCMPESLVGPAGEAIKLSFEPRSAVLTFEELERVITVFARLGVRKIRLTGGEPTVRRGIVDLVTRIAGVPGIEQIVMTTNGHLLAELAAPLKAAGVSAVNVSLDTLDPARFAKVTGRGDLARVLAGMDAARAVGMAVKTNAVALYGVNDTEIVALCEAAWSRGATPRFIEHMPMSHGALYEPAQGIAAVTIRRTIEAALGALVPARPERPEWRDAGPARYWALPASPGGGVREVGIISAMTEHFCDDCNRLRLTSTGALHACLGHDDALSLRDLVRAGGSDEDLVRAIGASVTGKRAGHTFSEAPPTTHMMGIGG
jgi:cyclic pyranopterin phosphate synthase